MEKDEERADAEREEERSPNEPRQRRLEASGGYARAVGVLAAAAAGVVLFVAGFFTHSLLDDDDDLSFVEEDLATLTGQVGAIQETLGIAVASPTPAPVVAASADDDPFMGPEDAPVTFIEFGDYQ